MVVPCTMQFLDGATLTGIMALNKVTRKALATETHIYTVDNPKFIHGDGAPAVVSFSVLTTRLNDACQLRTNFMFGSAMQASRRWFELRCPTGPASMAVGWIRDSVRKAAARRKVPAQSAKTQTSGHPLAQGLLIIRCSLNLVRRQRRRCPRVTTGSCLCSTN